MQKDHSSEDFEELKVLMEHLIEYFEASAVLKEHLIVKSASWGVGCLEVEWLEYYLKQEYEVSLKELSDSFETLQAEPEVLAASVVESFAGPNFDELVD